MRLTTVILIASLLQVSAAGFAQKITLSQRNTSLEAVLKEIRKQSGYDYYYDSKIISEDQKVNVFVKDATIDQTLKELFTGLPLVYEIEGKMISIKKKEPSFLENVVNTFVDINVSGRVVDADGRGLPGASVSVKGKGKEVSTGANGSFYLKGVDEDAVLVISFIGYVPKEVTAVKELGDVVLELSNSKLDEVQVIAYGTTTQRLSTGNVTTIKADVIEKQPVNNPLLALQGRVPGLFIEQATGFAGTGIKVRIQGQNSIINGNDPLYVIDGIPFTSQLLQGTNPIVGYTENNPGNPLNFINPADIESIDVLKDADATSIYGSRAANGAILITTKKGKSGDITINANLQDGWGRVARKLDLMDAHQYLEMRKEALTNDGATEYAPGPYGDNDLNGNWDNTRSTDWQKELIGGVAKYTDLQASISGGSNNVSFLAGAGYHKEGNVMPGKFTDTKGSIHFSINGSSLNQKFKIQLSGSYLQDKNLLPNEDLTSVAMTLAPVAPKLLNENGNLNWQPDNDGNTTFFSNPMGIIFEKNLNKTSNLIGNSTLSYQVIPELDIRSSFGYTNLQSNTLSNYGSGFYWPESLPYLIRATTFGNSNVSSWLVEPQLNFHHPIWKGNLEVLIGGTIQREGRNASSINASGFATDQVMEDIMSATSLLSNYSVNSTYRYNALFGRINYNLFDKYIVNVTARRDGSSRFGKENLFHNFGAIGVAWIFSEEKFVKDRFGFISFGKIRGSYGTTGNDKILDYQFLSLYNPIGVSKPYQGAIGYQPAGLTNPYLQWEESKKIQFGLDLGFFKDRLLLNVNYSQNRSSNQLLNLGLPIVTGFYGIAANFEAKVENSGWEFTLSSTNLVDKDFKWISSINLTIPKNRLLAYPDYKESPASLYVIGQSLNIQRKFHLTGLEPTTGLYQFSDHNGNLTSSPVYDLDNSVTFTTDPRFYGGLQNTLTYKNFQLDLLFQFTKQIAQNNSLGASSSPPGAYNSGFGNQLVLILNRWQKPGDIATIQKYNADYNLYGSYYNAYFNSDANWGDASYIRLKNLSFSWQIPQKWKSATHLRNCKLYAQGQNLLTITNYLGLDPESKNSLRLPPLRVITIGVQIGL